MFHIPNLVRYLRGILNTHWEDFRRGHGVGSGQYMSPGLIFFKILELDKSWNGAHLNMIPPICHPGLCWLLVENYSWCALDMGVVGRLFSIFVIRSKQWLWWLFICVSVVNHNSDFKTWDQFLQHCDQGNIMLSRPIITLWFGVMVYFSTCILNALESQDALGWKLISESLCNEVLLWWVLLPPLSMPLLHRLGCEKWHWKQPKGKCHKIFSCSTLFVRNIDIFINYWHIIYIMY